MCNLSRVYQLQCYSSREAEQWYMTLTPGSPLKMATMEHLDDLLATTIPAVKRKKNKMTGVTKYTKVTAAKQMKV